MDRTQHIGVIESEQYAATRTRLTQDPVVRAMAAELYAGISAGKVTSESLFHDDGSPRFELMQRTNAEYTARGGSDQAHHIGAIAEAMVLVWNETPGTDRFSEALRQTYREWRRTEGDRLLAELDQASS